MQRSKKRKLAKLNSRTTKKAVITRTENHPLVARELRQKEARAQREYWNAMMEDNRRKRLQNREQREG